MASSELLKQIQAGKRLKRAETNDRSAPLVDNKPKTGGPDRSDIGGGLASVPLPVAGAGPPQLGNLFAGGMPKLKPAGQGNLAKPSALGKPPAVPGRETAKANTPSPPTRSIPPKPASSAPPKPPPTRPVPPIRPSPNVPRAAPSIPLRPAASAPSIPARPAPSAPSVPRRPAPPARAASPPAILSRPSPPIPSRSNSPPTTKPAPSIPSRSISQATTKSSAGRAPPPPPPPRPNSMSLGSASKAAPPPPARKAQPTTATAPQRVRELSEGISAPASPASRTSLLPPTVRMRTASGTNTLAPPPSRTAGNGNPSPEYSGQRFEVEGFPPPREFREGERRYLSGRERGSEFML